VPCPAAIVRECTSQISANFRRGLNRFLAVEADLRNIIEVVSEISYQEVHLNEQLVQREGIRPISVLLLFIVYKRMPSKSAMHRPIGQFATPKMFAV
jgi:hypothetical protein